MNIWRISSVLLVLLTVDLAQAESACEANASWKEDCNDCVCDPTRLRPVCTRRVCPGAPCEPDSSWKRGCNDCVCGPDLLSVCTRRDCSAATTERDAGVLERAGPSRRQDESSCGASSPMVISTTSDLYDWWRSPPTSAQPLLKLYIFNYTNAETFGPAAEKPRVEEVGPFTYRETTEKIDIVFHNSTLVSYREKKSYQFLPELSAHSEDVMVYVPNALLVTLIAGGRTQNVMGRFGLNTFMRPFDPKPILHISVRNYLFGPTDDMCQALARIIKPGGSSECGILALGESNTKYTVHTGVGDACRLGELVGVDDKVINLSLRTSASDECHRVDGSPDGRQFPPPLVQDGRSQLHYFHDFVVRRLPLRREGSHGGAHRYRVPSDVFASPADNPDNRCSCPHADPAQCLPSGVFNSSMRHAGAPVFVSSPHFLHGAASLHRDVLGLRPDPERHGTFLDVDPTLGVAVGGAIRLQVNVQVRKAGGVMDAAMRPFQDMSILPTVWLETVFLPTHRPNVV